MPLISASRMPACRSVTASPFRFSIRCTNSSTLPSAWQPKQWKTRLARFTEQLGSAIVVEGAQDLHLIALPHRA